MKTKIKINFSDFWGNFNKENNVFVNLLKDRYQIEISDKPDILFYSVYSKNYLKYNCIRVLFTGENVRPDFNECDFSISFDYDTYNGKNYRFPLYLFTPPHYYQKKNLDIEQIIKQKTKFCSFIVSNPNCRERNIFFEKLSKYKKVDSGGKFMNNIGYRVPNKSELLINYKFNIAFENESYPGYTTEKIIEPVMNNCVPIYWGNPLIHLDFNTKSFINVHDYKNFDEVIEKIIEIDNNNQLYKQYLQQPFLHNNIIKREFTYEALQEFLFKIIDNIDTINKKAKRTDIIKYYAHQINNKIKRTLKNSK